MTEPKLKSETLSETTKTYLKQIFREERYGRKYEFSNKYVQKGLDVEEDSLTLYSLFKKKMFVKNSVRFSNEFICGTPDIIIRDRVTDIKSSWNLFTLPFPDEKVNKDYFWQLQGYTDLVNVDNATLAYCLVNTPEMMIEDEKRKLAYKMGALTTESPDYVEACADIDKAMTFDDIPKEERVIEYHIQRDTEAIEKLYKRIEQCREYLNQLHAQMPQPELIA